MLSKKFFQNESFYSFSLKCFDLNFTPSKDTLAMYIAPYITKHHLYSFYFEENCLSSIKFEDWYWDLPNFGKWRLKQVAIKIENAWKNVLKSLPAAIYHEDIKEGLFRRFLVQFWPKIIALKPGSHLSKES